MDNKSSDNMNKKTRRKLSEIQKACIYAFVFVLTVWILFTFFAGITTVPNADMRPRLEAGDLVIYFRMDKSPNDRDIVVFEKNDTEYIGRVVAKAGDTVDISDSGNLVINGNSVMEEDIYYPTVRYEGYTTYPLTLGEGEYFILIDKRDNGEDSRYFGAVRKSEISGTVITVIRRRNL